MTDTEFMHPPGTHCPRDEADRRHILEQLSVLLVEDDAIIRFSVSSMFAGMVREVRAAATAEEGLALYRAATPDLIITDIRTPGMSGLEMIEHIRREDRETPIIVSTSYNETPYLLRAIDLGVDKYVVKPVDRELLLEAMARLGELAWRRRTAEEGRRFTRFLLDLHPNFMVTVREGLAEYINATMLRHLGFASLEEFQADGRPLGAFLQPVAAPQADEPAYAPDGWLDYLLSRPSGKSVLRTTPARRADQGDAAPADPGRIVLAAHAAVPQSDRHVLSFTDVTSLEEERRSLEGQARTDPLTGLLNRRTLLEMLTDELQRCERYKSPLNCILFDIDDFKAINDRHGHHVGDEVLVTISRLVSDNVRKLDRLARWGGEEFVILAPGCSCREAGLLADKLRRLIGEHDFGAAGRVTCSFGVTDRRSGEDAETLLRRADQAMYQAKGRGKNAIVAC